MSTGGRHWTGRAVIRDPLFCELNGLAQDETEH